MFLLDSFQTSRWRTIFVSLLAVVLMTFATVPRVQAVECRWYDVFTLFYTCYKNNLAEDRAASISQGVVNVIEPAYNRMVDRLAQRLTETIKTSAIEIRVQFEIAMENLFDKKIKLLLKDIDKLLETRIDQTDQMIEARLKQIDALIEARLKQIDALIQNTFEQFQKAAGKTITQIKTDIVDNTFNRMEKLRQDFRNDVENFFERTEYIINTVDCKIQGMQEQMRQDMQGLGKEFIDKLQSTSLEIEASGTSVPIVSIEGKGTFKKNEDATSTKPSPELVACFEELGIESPPPITQYATIYDIEKCRWLRSLTPDTPIEQVLNVYLDLRDKAARTMCLQRPAGRQAIEHYTPDWLEFGEKYDFWSAFRR